MKPSSTIIRKKVFLILTAFTACAIVLAYVKLKLEQTAYEKGGVLSVSSFNVDHKRLIDNAVTTAKKLGFDVTNQSSEEIAKFDNATFSYMSIIYIGVDKNTSGHTIYMHINKTMDIVSVRLRGVIGDNPL